MSFLDRAKHTLDTVGYNIGVARTVVRAKLEDGFDTEIEPISMDEMFRPQVHVTGSLFRMGDGVDLAERQQKYVDEKYGPMFATDAEATDDGTVRIRVPKEYSEDGWATVPALASRELTQNQRLVAGLSGVSSVAYVEADYKDQVDCRVIKDGQETTTKIDRTELHYFSEKALEAYLWLDKAKRAHSAAEKTDTAQADGAFATKPRMVFANYVSDKFIREQPMVGTKENNGKSFMVVSVPCTLSEDGFATVAVKPGAVRQAVRKGEPMEGYSTVVLGSPDTLLKVSIKEGSKYQQVDMRAADVAEMFEFGRASYRSKLRPELDKARKEVEAKNDAFRGMGDPSADVSTPTEPAAEDQLKV
jgi:hypothetical protein